MKTIATIGTGKVSMSPGAVDLSTLISARGVVYGVCRPAKCYLGRCHQQIFPYTFLWSSRPVRFDKTPGNHVRPILLNIRPHPSKTTITESLGTKLWLNKND